MNLGTYIGNLNFNIDHKHNAFFLNLKLINANGHLIEYIKNIMHLQLQLQLNIKTGTVLPLFGGFTKLGNETGFSFIKVNTYLKYK